MSRLSNLYATLEANGINMPKDISVFEKNMGDSAYRRKLYKGLQEKGLRLKQSVDEFDAIWSKEFGESKPNSKPTTDEDLAKTFVMSPEWQEDYARGKEVEKEIKAEDAKRKQTADAYNAYAKLEDSFAKYEQSQDVSDLFNVGQQEPIFGEGSKKYWRNKVAQRKEGEAQAKAKVDQERKELRQRMQLLKDNPDAYDELFGIKVKETPEVGLRPMKSFVNGKPVDKRGNVHDNWVSRARANQRIDAEDKALQLGFQQQELQDMLADPMTLEKTMREVEAEIERLGKARDAAAQKYGSEHPFLSLLSGAKGTRSLDPWLEGAYGPEAQSITLELEKAFAKLDNLKNIEKKIKSGELPRGGFWNGVGQMGQAVADKVTDRSWGMYEGMSNMLSESEKQIVFDKIAKGEPLTASEMQWATIDLLEGKVNTEVDSPYLYNITSGLMESAPYMRDILLSPGKGISGAFVNWGKSRYGATGFLKLVGNALQGAATTATVGADELVSGTSERMRGDLSFGENGLEVTGQKSLGRALTQQFASQTASNMVELMGVPLLDKAGKYIGKAVKEVADGLSYGKVSKVLSAMDKSSAVNWVNGVRKSMGIHSLPAEIGEEYVDGFAQSIVEGEDQLSPMLNTEEFLNIAGTCGLMSAIFGSANVAGFATEFHKVNREFKKAKQEVLRQFSSDAWASLDNLITNAQDEDLTVRLADAMDGMAMNREQRSAIMNYLTALKRYQKFNELNDGGKFIIGGPQQAQATQSTSTSTYEIDSDITLKDEIGNPIDAHIIGRDANGNYMVESSQPINGKRVQPLSADQLDAMVIPNTPDGIQQSEVDGYNMTDANQQAEVSMLTDNARESVATLLGVTPDAVDITLQQVLGDNPTDAKIEARFGDNAQVVKDYMYNVAKTKGMSARLIDDIADATAESDRAIDAVDNNGNVVTAMLGKEKVNITSGEVVTFDDGVVDKANSSKSVTIKHADGTTEMVAPTSLTEVVSMPTEQAKATQAQAIAQQKQQAFSDKLNGVLDYSQGQQYTMLNADGSTTDVTILADNGDGNVTVTARDGNKEGGVTDGKQIVLPKSQIQQGVREFKRNQLRGESARQTSIPQAEVQPTEVAEPTQEPTMPTDEQGNVLYEQMDADSAWDALLAETGGDADMAMTVANEMIADKTKAVEEASKMVAEPGTTPQEKIANLKAVKQAQAQAQAELDAWKAIAEAPNRRMSIAEEATTESVVESTPTESESTPQVGLVEDARTRTLGDKTRKMLDAMAKRLGLQVEFVDEVNGGKANADIVGNKVRIAWDKRDQALDFLLGHEFTHRMQDLSPEAYAEFVEATKQALGEEEWNKRINRMKSLYKQHGITISEQGIIDEVVADYAGELVEERGVFDNFVERNKNNRSLLSKIADVLRSIKEFFTLGKQRKVNNAIKQLSNLIEASEQALPGYLEAERARGQIQAETGTKPRFSVSATMIGAGFEAFAEDGKSPILDEHGNVAMRLGDKMFSARNLVSAKDIKGQGDRSPLNMMINDALELGTINQQKADEMYGKVADILNSFLVAGSAQKGGYANMAENWLWLGETVYRTIATNGDSQYKYSADITRVCKKNEAVIRSISALQKKVGYGITPGQIMDIYYQTSQKGYQVPCPVCYVFSRYMHNGKYATAAINGMRKYGEHLQGGNDPWTAEQWVEEYNRLVDIKNDKKNVNALKNATADVTTTLDKMDKLAEHVDRLGAQLATAINKGDVEKQEKIRATIQLLDARYRAALNVISQQSLTNWIKMFAIEKRSGETLNEFAEDQSANEKGGYLNPNEWRIREDNQKPTDIKDFEEHALDLRRSAETMGKYPAITRLRKSGGSAAGKAIAFESNNEVGEFISGLNTSDPENATNWYMEAYNNPDNATYRKKAKERFAKSVVYAGQQSLRGGQRMWSWSDYIESLGPDVVINLLQLELLGGALQTYSKQLEGNNLVARMEGYVNGSLMAHGNGVVEVSEDQIEVKNGKEVLKDAITETIQENTLHDGVKERTRTLAEKGSPIYTDKNGKKHVLTFDDVVGIDPHGRVEGGARKKGLFDINRNLNRSGNILVGMNDTHIKTALADPRIFFVIPWHASGQSNHILSQMLNILGVNTRNFTPMDYTNMQSEKDYNKKDVVLPSKVVDLWERIKTQSQAEEWGDGGIDSNAKGQLTDSQKNYRRLRAEIFDGKYDSLSAEDKALIDNDAFLSQVKDKVSKVASGKMTNDDNNHIYPYEYWDEASTYEKADINGKRYLEYCRRLGFRPKFSGKWDKGDKWSSDGDFTQDKGYWKLLVDRRMYDVDGNFQGLTPVSVSGYSTELTDPKHNAKEFVTTQVADDQGAVDIANEVYEAESKRTEKGMPQVDYNMDMSTAVAEYNKLPKVKAGERTLIKEAQTEAQKSRFSLTDLTEEEQRIVDEAKANGTYLKAPNGKASNLNERQWIQVRTKAFKDWFGDWENDPENASKVVDENGEPMVVYHGSYWNPLEEAEGKAVFDKKYSGANTDFNATDEGFANTAHIGHWFNSSAVNLSFYDNIIPAFLNIKNPEKFGSLEGLAEELTMSSVEDFIEKLDEYEYDGVMLADEEFGGTSYVALQPTQIKSATENVGTFDASNPDIRYSLFGGNSGYVGYSMSKRAARARAEGRYPKTDFKKEYSVTAKSFEELVDAKIIVSGEWHHTSMYGNETKFYHWDKDFYADIYEENKAVIDKLSRERKTDEIVSLFENHPLAHKAEYDNETERLVDDVNREYNDKIREVEKEKRDKERAYNSAVFDALGQLTNVVKANNGNLWFNASNGVGIQIDSAGNEVSMNYGGANGSKGALRYEARNELQTAIESVAKESNIESADATYYTDKVNQLEAERAERVAQLVETREKEYTTEQTDIEGDYGGERYSLVTDPATIEMLESAPKVSNSGVKLYRAMIEIDGKLYPPMSSMVEENGEKVLREGISIGDWVKSDEDLSKATLRNGKYYFDLLKDDGTSVDQVAYNPYLHTSDSMLNDQFKSAQSRPNLVVVEMEIPITGDYKAEGAKDAVGFVPGGWKSGEIALQLPTTRNVYLSQYGKVKGIVPTEEVAQHIYDKINGYVDVMPSNVVTPQVREALEKMGVQFVETDNQSVILEGRHKGKSWTQAYGKETIRKREEKSLGKNKANTAVKNAQKKLDKANAELKEAKANLASLEKVADDGAISKSLAKSIQSANNKVAKAEANVATAKDALAEAKANLKKVDKAINEAVDDATRYSLQGGRSIADKYEKRVNTKGVGGAMHLSKFNFMEAWQDEMRALKEVQRIIEQDYGIVLESYEDAYMAENALSSVNQAEWERYIKDYYEPMMQIIDKWILKGGETEQSVNHYLIAKSGLERNREFTVRDALAEMDKMDRQIINGAYSGTVLQLANALRQGQISQDEYDTQVQEAKDKKNQALENIRDVQRQRVDDYRAERDALRDDLQQGRISYEEFNQLSDEAALRHSGASEIKDYSGLTALAKAHGRNDWQLFAQGMVTAFENKHDNTDVLWERINNATKKAVEKSYESGITSKEAKNHLDQMFLWYVPMGGMENDTAEDIYSYLNRNADSAFTQTVKRAEGHSEHISDDVMAMIANTMQSAILQGNRNKMKQKFLNMVENYPTDLFTLDRGWVVMQGNEWVESHPEIKADYTAEQVRDAINAHNEEMRNLEEQGLAMSKEGALKLGIPLKNKHNEQEHAISVMRNGQKVTIYVNGNPRVAQALNGKLKDVEQTWIGKAYGNLKRYFSASKTSWNPDFVSSNFSRDIGHSTSMTFVRHGVGEWGKSIVMYAPATATLVAKALGKKSPWGAKYDQYFDEFVRNGGVTGYSHLYSVDDWKIENTKRIDRLRGVAKAIKAHNNLWVNLGKVYNEINSIIENSSRFNEYARSRNRGEDVATSVWNAKEITLNFNKKGSSKTEGLFGGLAFLGRNLVPFFNPIMQGIYQFLKISKEHKRRMAALCFGYMGMGFFQPFVNAMLVELLGGGDEDDYMKQPEYTRRTNFMLYTGDGYIKIPLAQIFREFYGIGDVVYCAMYGKLSEEDATSQAISQVRRIFSLDDVSTYFDWVADIATNTNFMGNPLWKENDYNKYKPEYTKAYDNTWSFLVSASKWLNEALGGDEHTAPEDFNGKWINPAIWQRVLSELGGGALTSMLDVYDTASALVHGEDVDWANVPIAKRLYTETDEETLQKWIDKEYFSNLDNYKMVRDRMSSLKSSNALDVAEKIDFMYHDPKYLEYVIFDDAQKEIKELRDKADSATDDNRAEREKALYDAELEVVEAIDAVRAMEDNEVQTYMMEHPEVAYYINKDIEQKVKGNVKELQKAIARKEPDARKALTAYRKTPEYKYYNQIRRILKRINKLESRLNDDSKNATPSQRLKWQKQIDDKKQELVELRKAYESIGEVKE